MVDYETSGDFSFLEEAEEYFDPESGELLLGDIVISKEKVLVLHLPIYLSPESGKTG